MFDMTMASSSFLISKINTKLVLFFLKLPPVNIVCLTTRIIVQILNYYMQLIILLECWSGISVKTCPRAMINFVVERRKVKGNVKCVLRALEVSQLLEVV